MNITPHTLRYVLMLILGANSQTLATESIPFDAVDFFTELAGATTPKDQQAHRQTIQDFLAPINEDMAHPFSIQAFQNTSPGPYTEHMIQTSAEQATAPPMDANAIPEQQPTAEIIENEHKTEQPTDDSKQQGEQPTTQILDEQANELEDHDHEEPDVPHDVVELSTQDTDNSDNTPHTFNEPPESIISQDDSRSTLETDNFESPAAITEGVDTFNALTHTLDEKLYAAELMPEQIIMHIEQSFTPLEDSE